MSVDPSPGDVGDPTARRISIDADGNGLFDPAVDAVLGWIGPPAEIAITGPEVTPQLLSRIEPDPYYRDWRFDDSGMPWADATIHIGDCEVSPGYKYLIQAIYAGDPVTDEASYSVPLALRTVFRFGDVTGATPGMPPDGHRNFRDVSAVIDGFQSTQTEPKAWLDLQGGAATPELPDFGVIGFRDIDMAVRGFQGQGYLFAPPCNCPGQTCSGIPAAECFADSDCDDGVFCNGAEACSGGSCEPGANPCVGQACDESGDTCVAGMLPILLGDYWQYWKGTQEPPADWTAPAFDAQMWLSGPTGIGYGDGDDATVLDDMEGNYLSVYARRLFHVENPSDLTALALTVDYDDGFVAYLNGVEIARSPSMEGQGDPPAFDTPANTANHEAGIPEVFQVTGFVGVLTGGTNVLAIQGHNHDVSSSDFSLLPSLAAIEGCGSDGDCDDGLFCNGAETCSGGSCVAGSDPCPGQTCDETGDTCATEFTCPTFTAGQQVGSVLQSDVVEASGLAASRQNPGVLWTHDDSGGDNVVFALNTGGTLLGTYRVGSGSVSDAEDIAIGPGPTPGVDYIFLGDIGDNSSTRSSIRVKRVAEPVVDPGQAYVSVTLNPVDIITLQYPGGADAPSHKDSETLFVDTNGDIYLVTKRMYPNKVYRAAYPQSTSTVNTLEYMATLPTGTGLNWITGGDITADGRWIIVTNDQGTDWANVWYRAPGTDVWDAFSGETCLIAIQAEPQGEAIAWTPDGMGFYTLSEAHHTSEPIWYYQRE